MEILRYSLLTILTGILMIAIPQALAARGIQISLPQVSLPSFGNLQSDDQQPVAARAPVNTALPAQALQTLSRVDLTRQAADYAYISDPR